MEGTFVSETGSANGFAVASTVLGIIGVLAFPFVLPQLLAIAFGITGFVQLNKPGREKSGKGLAIAGICCGIVGVMLAAWYYH